MYLTITRYSDFAEADVILDNYWYTYTRRTPPAFDLRLFPYTVGQSSRIHTIWKLRPASQDELVAQAIIYLFPWAVGDEVLRLPDFPDLPVD